MFAFLNINLDYCQDPNIHDLACTQGAVAVTIVKHTVTLKNLYTSKLSTNEVKFITEEVGRIFCMSSRIFSCRALLVDSF